MSAPQATLWRNALGVVAVASAAWFVAFAVGMRHGAPLLGLGVVSAGLAGLAVTCTLSTARGATPSRVHPSGVRTVFVGRWTPVVPHRPHARRALRIAFGLVVGLVVGALTLAATHLMWPVLRAVVPGAATDVQLLYAAIPVTPTTVPVVLLVVLAEEILWRGLLVAHNAPVLGVVSGPHVSSRASSHENQHNTQRSKHLWVIALASTALYAAAQAGSGLALLSVAGLFLGALWAAEAILTGSLLAPAVSHALWTLSVFWITPLHP